MHWHQLLEWLGYGSIAAGYVAGFVRYARKPHSGKLPSDGPSSSSPTHGGETGETPEWQDPNWTDSEGRPW